MTGYIHSLQSLGTVDGPGVRAVVFAAGCPLRCIYCHNPDTWERKGGTPTEHAELATRIKRLYSYIKDGGVTFSGGEPCMQSKFFSALADELHCEGLHVALDTSGAIVTEAALELIDKCDLILLDVKFTHDRDALRYTGADLSGPMAVLGHCESVGKPVWIRHVVVPGINDTEEDAKALGRLIAPYGCIERIEFLPFRKLCLEKYERLGIPFALKDTPEADADRVKALESACVRTVRCARK